MEIAEAKAIEAAYDETVAAFAHWQESPDLAAYIVRRATLLRAQASLAEMTSPAFAAILERVPNDKRAALINQL